MEKKITYVEALDVVLANENIVLAEDVRAKLEALKGSLVKKAENKKETAKQKENAGIKSIILEIMANGVSGTCTEIGKSDDRLVGYTVPKMSALLNQLVKDGLVVKSVDGKKSIFSIAE